MPVTTYKDLTIHYNDEWELKALLEEVFRLRTYYFECDTNTPFIIDCGAHIGLPVLYWHKLYPQAQYLCFEPHPDNVANLKRNIEDNNVEHVEIVQKALAAEEKQAHLHTNNQWTVFSSLKKGGWTGEEAGEPVAIETTKLSTYITKPVQLLKMDIEGSETEVLFEAKDKLHFVERLILEFHETKQHSKDKVLKLLKNTFKTVDVIKDERKERNRTNQLYLIEAYR